MQQSLRTRIAHEKTAQLCYGLARYGVQLIIKGSDNDVSLCINPWPPQDIPNSDRYKGILEITRQPHSDEIVYSIQATLYRDDIKKSYIQLHCKLTGPGQWLVYI